MNCSIAPEALFAQALLDVLLFNVIELCFEQALISLDVLLMCPQTVISLGHSPTQKCLSGKLSPASIAAILDNLQERYRKAFSVSP
jgi:hypothetical protein